MGVDVYMTWKGFGRIAMTNPNYKKQITGFADAGKHGYLRIAYSDPYYRVLAYCLCWDWDNKIHLTESILKEFENRIKLIPETEEFYREKKIDWLKFSELARRLNKEGKKPKAYISY